MKQTNLKTLNELQATVQSFGAGENLRKKNYVKPTTVMNRVLLEMDVLSASMVETRSMVSAGFSDHEGNPFGPIDGGTTDDILIGNTEW